MTVIVLNVNLDILLTIKMDLNRVYNAIMQIVLNVKITLVTVKHVFMDMLYISLSKSAKSQQFLIANQSLMVDAKFVMKVIKLMLILLAKLTVELQIVKSVRTTNLVQNVNLDLIWFMKITL